MREINSEQAVKWTSNNSIYKKHILPTENNQKLLKHHRKVILLRDPVDIVLSYRRTQYSGLSEKRNEFRECKTEEEWISQAKKNGLLEDLNNFYYKWLDHDGEKLIIYFEQFVKNPNEVINSIADYWSLPKIDYPVTIAKVKYTRINFYSKVRMRFIKVIKIIKKKRKRYLNKTK